MSSRPDLDEDVRRLHEHPPIDEWGIWRRLFNVQNPDVRRQILADFAASSLRALLRSDMAELYARGIRAVPVYECRDSTMQLWSSDQTREVEWTYLLQQRDFEVNFSYTDRLNRSHKTRCASVRIPIGGTDDYQQLPGQVQQCAAQVRAFLLHGERPR